MKQPSDSLQPIALQSLAPQQTATRGRSPDPNPGVAAQRVLRTLSAELQLPAQQIQAAIDLLDGGATVPFIARYRKEATGGLSDAHLRALEERLIYLRELEDRRAAILLSLIHI